MGFGFGGKRIGDRGWGLVFGFVSKVKTERSRSELTSLRQGVDFWEWVSFDFAPNSESDFGGGQNPVLRQSRKKGQKRVKKGHFEPTLQELCQKGPKNRLPPRPRTKGSMEW